MSSSARLSPPAAPSSPETAPASEPIQLPSPSDRHLLSRFSFGVTPDLVADSAAAGGARAWFEDQLSPGDITDDEAEAIDRWWPTILDSYAQKQADADADRISPYEQNQLFARWTLLHRIATRRQVLAVMTDFWMNLLFVNPSGKTFQWCPDLERVIRANALGRYTDLLRAAVLHPAMLVFLDNARSTVSAPNENLGRELLELHTVGRETPFNEREVQDSMRILTGYRVELDGECDPFYSEDDHATGAVDVLGFEHPNQNPNGESMTEDYLDHLATLPATAERLAKRLVRRFVSDDPRPELVAAVADAYLGSGSDISVTLRALVDHPDFLARATLKVRTPIEDCVNTFRVLQVKVLEPTTDEKCAAYMIIHSCGEMGQRPYDWPRPDGFPDSNDTWTSASRMLGSWRTHRNVASARFPKVGITHQPNTFWMPELPASFETVAERMCGLLLAKPLTSKLLRTACKSVKIKRTTIVTEESDLYRKEIDIVLGALLDTPDHMSR